MYVIVAMDAFKGCASSHELSIAVKQGIVEVDPHAIVKTYEIADGGEGTLEAMVANSGGEIFTCKVHDPLMQEIDAAYGILGNGKTCVIEMARAAGLPLVPPHLRNPLITTTYGVGELIRAGLDRGCETFIVGIGGSATNDAGVGMLQALGFSFLDREGKCVGLGGAALGEIVRIDASGADPRLKKASFIIACDVDNPMYGAKGAARIYAPQKGATPDDVEQLDANVKAFATCMEAYAGRPIAQIPGSGAAGAMGGGCMAFLEARLCSGIDIVLDAISFDAALEEADVVITGEGKIDAQSLMGKVISGIAKRCIQKRVPLIALAGSIEEDAFHAHNNGVSALFSILPKPMSLEEAMDKRETLKNITHTTQEIFRVMQWSKESFR